MVFPWLNSFNKTTQAKQRIRERLSAGWFKADLANVSNTLNAYALGNFNDTMHWQVCVMIYNRVRLSQEKGLR